MGAIALLLILILLIIVGVVTSVRLYSQGVVGSGRIRSIRHIRRVRSTPEGQVIEDTTEEISDDEEPVEEVEG